jgi:WD40 repeat protein
MFSLILAGMSLPFGAAPPAEPFGPTPLQRKIAGLIKQLGDDSFDKREAASKTLESIGKPAVRALRKAAGASTDLEIRWRAACILVALAARFPGLMQKGEEIHRIRWANIHAFNTAFSPDGRFFVAGGDGSTLRLYEVKTGKQVRDLVGHTHYTQQAIFTPDGKQVLSASSDGTLRLWDLATGKEVRRFAGHTGGAHSVDLTPDGKWAVSGGVDKTLRLWEVATGKEVRKFAGHTQLCMAVFSSDGKQILSSGFDKTMRLWDVATGKELRTFTRHTSILLGAFFLPGGKQALSYSCDQTARVWDLATGKEVRKLDLGPRLSDIRGLALSPDGKRILVGNDWPAMVRLLDLATGKEVQRFTLATNPRGLSFSRDGRLAASGSHRGVVYLWRMPGIFDVE